MPSTRSVTRYILIAVALAALAVLVWRISEVVIAAFGGIVGAAVLRVLSRPLAKHTRLGERWSVLIAVVVVLAALGLLGWLFGSQVADQAAEMRRVLPDATRRVVDTFQQSAVGRAVLSSTKQAAQQSNPMSGVSVAAGAVFRAVGDLLLIFFLSLYFALDPGEYLRGLLRLFPPSRRGQVESALREAGEALEKWVFAQLIAMAVVGAAVGVSLGLLGVPLALLLGTMAAMLEFIPVVGPIIFTVPGLLVAFTQGPHVVFYVLLVYVAIQQVESNILTPLLQRWAVRLPPVIALLSVLAGGLLFGVMGVVFATPAAVVVTALVKHLYVEDTLERPRAGASMPPAG
jgi:predicted PurR-regulated permease PerM